MGNTKLTATYEHLNRGGCGGRYAGWRRRARETQLPFMRRSCAIRGCALDDTARVCNDPSRRRAQMPEGATTGPWYCRQQSRNEGTNLQGPIIKENHICHIVIRSRRCVSQNVPVASGRSAAAELCPRTVQLMPVLVSVLH